MTSATATPSRGARGRSAEGHGYGLVLFAAILLAIIDDSAPRDRAARQAGRKSGQPQWRTFAPQSQTDRCGFRDVGP
jgi:hypothetical protein